MSDEFKRIAAREIEQFKGEYRERCRRSRYAKSAAKGLHYD